MAPRHTPAKRALNARIAKARARKKKKSKNK